MFYLVNLLIFIFALMAGIGLVYYYSSKNTTWFTIIITFIGWLMGFLIIALLPLDIFVVIFL